MQCVKLNLQHDDVVHDIVFDYYGSRFATCSSDKKIKVFQKDAPSVRIFIYLSLRFGILTMNPAGCVLTSLALMSILFGGYLGPTLSSGN